MLHVIFQRHHIPPDEVFRKDRRHRRFMYASMEVVLDQEAEEERKRKQKQQQR